MGPNYSLQPFIVFRNETTRLNELYWTSRYCFSRVTAILGAIASLGHSSADPRVDTVWPSVNQGERRHITLRNTEFTARCDDTLGQLRTAAILHLCSAFENFLANNLVLCFLYHPSADPALSPFTAVPQIIRERGDYGAFVQLAVERSSAIMRGTYAKRLRVFVDLFGIAVSYGTSATQLDRSYAIRNRIAHDQALAQPDAPDVSAVEILKSRVLIDEESWKTILGDFFRVSEALDRSLKSQVVVNGGLHLAVYRYVNKKPGITANEVANRLQNEWSLPASSMDVLRAARDMGLVALQGGVKHDRGGEWRLRVSHFR